MIRKIDSQEIIYLRQKDKILSKIIVKVGNLEYELYKDPYKFLVFTIIGQMLSNKVGDKLFQRLEEKCDGLVTPMNLHKLSNEDILSIGISKRKVTAIRALTKNVLEDVSFLGALKTKTNEEIIKQISNIKGIGPWTAKMLLIFVLDRMDVLPFEDGAFIAAYSMVYKIEDATRDKRYIRKQCEKWIPYSSLAARYLYRFYDSELKYRNDGLHGDKKT